MEEQFSALLKSSAKIEKLENILKKITHELAILNKEEINTTNLYNAKLEEIKTLKHDYQKELINNILKFLPLIFLILSIFTSYFIYHFLGLLLKPIIYLININLIILLTSRVSLIFVNKYFQKEIVKNTTLIELKEKELQEIVEIRKRNFSKKRIINQEKNTIETLINKEKAFYNRLQSILIKYYSPYLDSLISKEINNNPELIKAYQKVLKLIK